MINRICVLYYLYLLGMNFDIVINFDGPLEIVHPYLKNFPINDEAIYPRRYSDELAVLTRDISCVKTNNEEVNKNSYVPLIELFSYLKKPLRQVFRLNEEVMF